MQPEGISRTAKVGGASAPVVATYYYPGYHRSAERNIRGGKTEWNLLYDDLARQAYTDVRRPLGGPVETTPDTLADEIQLAQGGGIDAFWWCWYWDRGRLLLNEALDMFLQCQLPHGFGYALMWVNKRPHFELPAEEPWSRQHDRSRLVETDETDFAAMIGHLIEHHWSRPQYLRIGNRPLLSIFTIEPLIRELGEARLARLLTIGDRMARSAGFDGVAYVAIMHRDSARSPWLRRLGLSRWSGDLPLRKIGFSAVSTYIFLPDWEGPSQQSYPALIEKRVSEWPHFGQRFGLPFWPSVAPGWDARVRAVPLDPPPRAHPWSPVISDESPQAFARWLQHWKTFARRSGDIPVLPVCSWNEWTEGHAIAPCDRHGEGMLEALRQFKASFATPTAAAGTR